MKVIGLTGGIGSGKSTVARYFLEHGIPVYYADDAGRKVLSDPMTMAQVFNAFGPSIFMDGQIDRKALADIVFADPGALAVLNDIVHPAVRADFDKWKDQHRHRPLVIREAAILFESGTDADCDKVILVIAPLEKRIERVMMRDNVSREAVLARMKNQWPDEKKSELSDFVIINDDLRQTELQCAKILKKLKNL